jgi:hypothetical protein
MKDARGENRTETDADATEENLRMDDGPASNDDLVRCPLVFARMEAGCSTHGIAAGSRLREGAGRDVRPYAQLLTLEQLSKMRRVSRVKVLRQRLGMTQM